MHKSLLTYSDCSSIFTMTVVVTTNVVTTNVVTIVVATYKLSGFNRVTAYAGDQ